MLICLAREASSRRDLDIGERETTAAIIADSNFWQAYELRGWIFQREQKFDRAIADFENVVRLAPGSPGGYVGLCFAHMEHRQRYEAVAYCDIAASRAPAYLPVHLARARVHMMTGDFAVASAELTQAISVAPNLAPIYLLRAHLDGQLGDFNAELADADKAIAVAPEIAADGYVVRSEALNDCLVDLATPFRQAIVLYR